MIRCCLGQMMAWAVRRKGNPYIGFVFEGIKAFNPRLFCEDSVTPLGLIDYGIRVNGIGPGAVNTELMKRVGSNKELMDTILRRTPIGRVAECAEIGRVAVFLASDDASFMVGQTVYPDGGRMIQSFDRSLN